MCSFDLLQLKVFDASVVLSVNGTLCREVPTDPSLSDPLRPLFIISDSHESSNTLMK